ncbi:IclR family transcriptional regulator [Halogeometricum borinquense]|uniref:IclR family transcriptional regulator n=1 Tax=Halogeometricum borinquense TaxID=60847 RepID=A0A6C0UN24_9EURY|nr:IclR family transcriptional regulator [Halogeometricum borinquense]QIB74328.1 IclR family transcriptional regulator [Halogeometricum borinquense]
MTERPRSNRPVTTTESSIQILEQLKDNPGRTLDELTEELDLARSTIHRHLLTLEDNDLLFRENGQFYLSLWLLDFGISARDRISFFDVARRQVDRLAEETGEKVWLVAKERDYSVHLYKASGASPLETSARVGQRRHLHQLAAGKAILAYLPDEESHGIIDRQGLIEATDQTITDREALLEELDEIRERGYAFNLGESIEGLNAVGAPIRDEEGTPVGGISISGPANRVKGSLLRDELPDKLLATIDEIHINIRYGSAD